MRKPSVQRNHEHVLAFVAAHPETCRLTVPELIEGTGLPRTTLYRAFQAHGGVNEFLISIRLEAARALLAKGLSCREVSKRCGFKAHAHFSKRFSASYGTTAHAYKTQRMAERSLPMS